jgi:hypothetical protein
MNVDTMAQSIPRSPRPRPHATYSTGTVLGIELDGSSATFSISKAGTVREVGVESGTSSAAALAAAIKHVDSSGAVVVAWVAPTGALHRTTIPRVSQGQRRRVAAASAADQLNAGESTCARLSTDSNDLVIGSASADEVASVLRGTHRPIELLVGPMVLAHDGLWLGVCHYGATLTQVDGGLPRLSRQLQCGGLAAPAAVLGRHGQAGDVRVTAVLSADSPSDSETARVLDTYVADLADEVRSTLAAWRRNDRVDSSIVRVYGAGAPLPTLEARFDTSGLRALGPPPMDRATQVDSTRLATSLLAIQASLLDPYEVVGFRNESADSRREAISRATARTRRIVRVGLLGGAATLGVIFPILEGTVARHLSVSRLHEAQAILTSLGPEERTYAEVAAARAAWAANASDEPDWSVTLSGVVDSAPTAVSIVSVDLDDTANPGFVTVTVQADGGPSAFADLEAWAHVLANHAGIGSVFTPTAQSDAGPGHSATKTSFELQFTIADTIVTNSLPFPGGPLP